MRPDSQLGPGVRWLWAGEAKEGLGSGRGERGRIRAWLGTRRRIGREGAGGGGPGRGRGPSDHPDVGPGGAGSRRELSASPAKAHSCRRERCAGTGGGGPAPEVEGAAEGPRGGEETGSCGSGRPCPCRGCGSKAPPGGGDGAGLAQVVGAGRRDGGVAAGPRLPPFPDRSGPALPDALLLPPWSPGHGSRARGRPVCGVTGGSGEAGIDWGVGGRGPRGGRGTCPRAPGASPSSPSFFSSPSLGPTPTPLGQACHRLPDSPFCPRGRQRLHSHPERPDAPPASGALARKAKPAAQLMELPHCPI